MQNRYLELKLSWEIFQKAPEALSDPERSRLLKVAAKQNSIEHYILASADAANVMVPAATLNTRVEEIRRRYSSTAEFLQNLEHIGLTEVQLNQAIERDMRVESVLEKVASDVAPIGAVDAEIYYRLHSESFDRPESRRLSHILITVDPVRENGKSKDGGESRAKVKARLEALRSTLDSAEKFGEAALRHSQCPTALEKGQLGIVKRKQLYAELETSAFSLLEGEVSEVLESPIGLHILRCDEIFPSGLLPFSEVCERIVERLTDKRRREAQRKWLKDICLAG